ncbi:probable glutathione S-transferase GSTU1 [Sorghum bicolor]|uniref:probable glutathione S-transferase GSTU1 n=1 Tax=Sorghum bicolor TaxID=4558 RepID=UPI000B4264B4|nr:probable glutathione S-transferase GSTU1 [Sorghum bicolor]|eukprot:XP_021315221.1 probable glutathione S-transferase GSTU1 [Sorghum bicolor]
MTGAESGSNLVLLDVFGSPYAQCVRIALVEKDLAYKRTEEDLVAKSDILRRSNPAHAGKVLVLLHAWRAICESLIILEYLDGAFPPPPLLSADPYARSQVDGWREQEQGLGLKGDNTRKRRSDVPLFVSTVNYPVA